MINIDELRSAVEAAGLNAISREEVLELLDRLEAAEKAVTEAYRRGYATGQEEIEKERDALRTRIEAMERQRPVRFVFKSDELDEQIRLATDPIWAEAFEVPEGMVPLYALPGAQPAPNVPAVPTKSLKPVIDWLRNGCDPMAAADELELLIAAAPEAKP